MAFFVIPWLVKLAMVAAAAFTTVSVVQETSNWYQGQNEYEGHYTLLPHLQQPILREESKLSYKTSTVNFNATTLSFRTSTKPARPHYECPSDEEEQRITNRQVIDVRDISARIWNSRRRNIDVQYSNPGSNRLFQVGFVDNVLSNLFQYYNEYTGQQDPCQGPQRTSCQMAQTAFIEAISNETGRNGPINVLHQWLRQEGYFLRDYQAFKDELKRIWFTSYTRSGPINDSSGFEHVFLGEMTRHLNRRNILCVLGFHNWMRMWAEETNRNYVMLAANPRYRSHGNIVASVQFQWKGSRPKRSSFFMETSPATEIALYTLCFMTQPDNDCQIELDNTTLQLRTHTRRNTAGLIGSAYPVLT